MHSSIEALFDLRGKTALVTGCNKGIGKAMALALAGAGADIIGVSASMSAYEAVLKQEFEQLGRTFTAYQADFSDRQQLYHFLEKLKQEHDRIDILVNNAGTIRRSPAERYSDADWDAVLAINLDAPFILAREIGKTMLERGSGKIIFHLFAAQLSGGHSGAGLCRQQGGCGQLAESPGQRMGFERGAGEWDCTGLYRYR